MPPNKTKSWRSAAHEVEKISKREPTAIDPGIRDAVIGLRAFGLPTESSCIGHLGIWGAPHPWIQFQIPKEHRTYVQMRRELLRHQQTLQELIDGFYRSHRPKHFEDRLSTHFFKNNQWGCFHLQNIGAQFLENCPPSVQARAVRHLRSEIKAFGKFLKATITESRAKSIG
jgi:hypothetical protein